MDIKEKVQAGHTVDKSNLYLTFKIHLYYALQSIIFFCIQLDRVFTSFIVTQLGVWSHRFVKMFSK